MVANKGRKKTLTRAQAERALVLGEDPNQEQFLKHVNYHVRSLCWKKMARPLPEDAEEATKFLASIHIKPKAEPKVLTESLEQVAERMAEVRVPALDEETLAKIDSV
jgi:hypothetical protein